MKKIFLLIAILFSQFVMAQDDANITVVAVGQAEVEKDRLALLSKKIAHLSDNNKKEATKVLTILKSDFAFYRNQYQITANDVDSIDSNFDEWSKKSYQYVITFSFVEKKSPASLSLGIRVYDVAKKSNLYSDEVVVSGDSRDFSHNIADVVYRSIFNKESIFKTKIYFVSDRLSRGEDIIKELYVMDFDGQNVRQLTTHNSIVISPAVSPNGKKVLYSVITQKNKIQNVSLFEMDVATRSARMLSNKKGINSGAVYTEDGKNIYLTLSYTGNSDIYEMNLNTRKLRKVTSHYADDVDPSISRDGKIMSFLSTRPGPAMIYSLDPSGDEKNVKRVSYVGKFNATPRFNPEGSEMAFASWVDNRFDIYRINRNGSDLSRLTKDFGSNEEPSYSNDGQFIAFSSQRVLSRKKAIQNIYIMSRDGEILGNITQNFGNCSSPRWSK